MLETFMLETILCLMKAVKSNLTLIMFLSEINGSSFCNNGQVNCWNRYCNFSGKRARGLLLQGWVVISV